MKLQFSTLFQKLTDTVEKNQNKLRFILILVPAVLIFFKLNTPSQWVYDEMFRITSAQKYLNGVFFLENHPPLGKLLIALGRYLYDSNISMDYIDVDWISQDLPQDFDVTGFRITPALFGTFIPFITYLIVLQITSSQKLAWTTALLISFDTFFLILSRIAMLDVFLLFFILIAYWVFWDLYHHPEQRNLLKFVLMGIFTACAMGVKDTGAILLVPVALLLPRHLTSIESKLKTGLYFAVLAASVVLIYLAIWQVHFSIAKDIVGTNDYHISETYKDILKGQSSSDVLSRFYVQFSEAFAYHINYNKNVAPLKAGDPNEIGSPWYYWPLGGKTINTRWYTPDYVHFSYIYLVGNPVTWLFSFLGVVLGTSTVLSDVFFLYITQEKQKRSLYILVFLYWTYMMPFWFVQRATYIHHYFPALIFGLIIMVTFLNLTITQKQLLQYFLLFCVILAVLAFWYYQPFVYFEPLTTAQFEIRNIWPIWQLKCMSC